MPFLSLSLNAAVVASRVGSTTVRTSAPCSFSLSLYVVLGLEKNVLCEGQEYKGWKGSSLSASH